MMKTLLFVLFVFVSGPAMAAYDCAHDQENTHGESTHGHADCVDTDTDGD